MSTINKEQIIEMLRQVPDPIKRGSIVSNNRVASVVVRDNKIGVGIEIPASEKDKFDPIRLSCQKMLQKMDFANDVTVVLTAQASDSAPVDARSIEGVDKIILVASGKGGVGKSTTAVNLAYSLSLLGKKVGIVDADIYGPSIPTMLGLEGKPGVDPDKKIIPLEKEGLKSMSMGYLVDDDQAAVWRGPMITKALIQLFKGVSWGNLDYLVVDMPPGTGDVQLTIAKQFNVYGAVLVTTPQEVAIKDVYKAYDMFKKVDIPVLGLIENMSYFEDSNGKKNYLFGKDGGKKLAKDLSIEFLADVEIDSDISACADGGKLKKREVFIDVAKKIIG